MATVFPFNQTSKIPGIVIKQLTPIVLKQVTQFNTITDKLQQQLASLKKVKCDDIKIQQLKNTLTRYKQILDNLNRINQQLQPLATRLQQVVNIAKPVATILLAVPAVIGVPEGPKNQTIQTIADLIAGIISVITVLNTLLKIFNNLLNIANKLITKIENKLASICNAASVNTNASANNINSSELSDRDNFTNAQYYSEFYQTINTSDSDIQNRVDEINNLIDTQLDVITNLLEAPSKVLYGTGVPTDSQGKISDYYIDTNTQTIYGPKPSQNSWT